MDSWNIIYENFDLDGKIFNIKTRYSSAEHSGKLSIENGKININFEEKAKTLTPGQSAVFYEGDILIGVGIIEKQAD